jgi:putative DNA primase/helicase
MANTTLSTLVVPEIPDDASNLSAGILYAEGGFYVIAVEPDTKKPAEFYGKGWPHMSSRDPQEIAAWFAGTNYALGVHCGRSGAVAFDIDEPARVPTILQRAFDECHPAIQSTRTTGARGHRLFRVPEGRRLGNSRGELGRENKEWGEVRGNNGIIVVEPSFHSKADEGGRYKWLTNGIVPVLPDYISELLPEAGVDSEAATDAVVAQFIEDYSSRNDKPGFLKVPIEKFLAEVTAGGSRHEAMVNYMCLAMRDVRIGFYPADAIIPTMEAVFVEKMAGDRHARSEFRGILAYAVAQALLVDPDERRHEAMDRLAKTDALKAGGVGLKPPPEGPKSKPHDPDDYFVSREAGIDMELLSNDVISLGPIARGPNKGFWTYDHGVWSAAPKEVRNRVVSLLGPRFRNAHAANAESFVSTLVGEISCDPIPDFMNFANGMLTWRTGELQPHGPHYGSTVQFPVEWDPEAKCLGFDDFLDSILSPDYVELAWQMIGYLMYSGNPKHKAFLLVGSGRNGKGTLLRVVNALLGANNVASESLDDLINNRFAAFNLFGKIANIAGDIDATYQQQTAAFKKLTGEDQYAAEQKYADRFQFQSWAVPVFSANKIPGSADTSYGYLSRWMVMEFDRRIQPEEIIDGLSSTLISELPGIAAKAVGYLGEVIHGAGFKNDGDVAHGKEAFEEEIDQVRQWLNECTMPVTSGGENRTLAYSSYKMWAASQGNVVLKAREFFSRIENAGYKQVKVRGDRQISGFNITEYRALGTAPASTNTEADDLPDVFGLD